MKPRSALLLLLSIGGLACGDDETVTPPVTPKVGEAPVEEVVAAMTLEEKVEQMHGLQFAPVDGLYLTPSNERLGIPGFKMVDGPRGVRAGNATAFPVAAARAATWNPELEREVGRAIGRETNAKGANVLLAPTINVLRHPAWGRAQETYSEDPTLTGAMGVAFALGAEETVLACAKHFAANSIEDTRFDVNVTIDERSLREVYLPHFKRIIDDGHVSSVMTAYNKVNGFHASENAHLVREILKTEWGFEGFVVSDWVFGTRSTVPAALAGLDIEMPSAQYFGPLLVEAVNAGDVPESLIDEAVTRILRKQEALAAKPVIAADVIESEEHRSLAREVAASGIVLLKNEAALPLSPSLERIAIVGELASIANLGDLGSSAVTPSSAVSPLDGITAALGSGATVTHFGTNVLSDAERAELDTIPVAIVVVGLTSDDEGEGLTSDGGDRETLRLSAEQEALIADVAAHADKTIVVLEGGSAIVVRPWVQSVDALLMAWYPGLEGGHAIADVLFGLHEPTGRLPVSFPRDEADLPVFDHDSLEVTYGFLHGYRHIDDISATPEYPFGFGLAYTTFGLGDLTVDAATIGASDTIAAHVRVTNTGARAGVETVQAYVHAAPSVVTRAPRDLRAFAQVELEPGESKIVELQIPASDLAYYDVATSAFIVEKTDYVVEVGSSARDLPLSTTVTIGD